jgi:hypothetical protein
VLKAPSPTVMSQGYGSTRITPDTGKPWVLHVYSPALSRNRTAAPKDRIPLFALHEPESNYHRLILVDRVNLQVAQGRVDIDHPIPSGVGGGVVAAIWIYQSFVVESDYPWNWGEDMLPPWLTIGEQTTRDDLYREVLRLYTKGGK